MTSTIHRSAAAARSNAPTTGALVLLAGAVAHAQPAPPPDWRSLEAPYLTQHVQLTSREDFFKAGESYFSPDAQWIIFQAVPAPKSGQQPGLFYDMYVAKVKHDTDGLITGLEPAIRLSPDGSANTCGWFHPTTPGLVLYGSTVIPPVAPNKPGFQVGKNKYVWSFPEEMEIVHQWLPALAATNAVMDGAPQQGPTIATPLFSRPDYDAECSWSKDGRHVLYAHVRESRKEQGPGAKADADIYVYDTKTKAHTPLVTANGYDGGPFFSPDENWICYRSDRNGDDLLQLFTAQLARDSSGAITGIAREQQVTQNTHVNWAPFWHPSGKYLIYGTSQAGHDNYEVFAVEFEPGRSVENIRQSRITWGAGADVLPAFNRDASWMIWTAQRGPMVEGETKPSSQVWAARVDTSITPEMLFRQLDEPGAIAAGKDYFAAQERADKIDRWSGEFEYSAEKTSEGWLVTQWQTPKSATGFRRVVIEPNGKVIRYVPPRAP